MKKSTEVGLVIAGGAIGGLVSVIDAWSDPLVFPLSAAKLMSLFVIPFVKGGVAAGIGVYVLTTLDQSHMAKAFFFSVTCGLAFPSILTKGGSLVDSVTTQIVQQEVERNAKRIVAALSDTDLVGNVEEIRNASDRIIDAGARAPENERRKAQDALAAALRALEEKADDGDQASTLAFTHITLQAANAELLPMSAMVATNEFPSTNDSYRVYFPPVQQPEEN